MVNTRRDWLMKYGITLKKYANTDILSASKFNLKEEGDLTEFFEKIEAIKIQVRKITDDTILEKDIC